MLEKKGDNKHLNEYKNKNNKILIYLKKDKQEIS